MGLRINTNMPSINAQRNLKVNQSELSSNFAQLSSGKRINKSADDAAGLAIAENLGGQIRSFMQAGRNAQDGISFVQVAEGGMNETSNMIARLRELSIQAASDTIGVSERSYLNAEAQQLKSEIQRLALSTEFNGRQLLAGVGEKLEFQIGVKNNEFLDRITYNPAGTNVTLDALGLKDIDISQKASAQGGLEKLDAAIGNLNSNRASLGALQSRLQSTINGIEVGVENFSAAKSRILDADVGSVSANLMRDQIKVAASTAVLAQANSQTQSAMKLLG